MFGKKKSKGKVFVGLSGGVDSAVSAALLQRQGYDVTGVFIRIAIEGYPCSAGEDKIEAMRVAAHLQVPFVQIDLSKKYESQVFKNTIEEFKKGRTPNPDTLCNREIKFGEFYKFALSRGADFIATGHYAQTKEGLLFSGADIEKDQSYFLWMIPQEVLCRTLFPVGHLQKSQVRVHAQEFSLPNATRKDSQGLCFLGDVSIQDMLSRELTPKKGNLLDEEGKVVGTHDGAALYTLGQRHGFTLSSHDPNAVPHFVIAKDIADNTVTISTSKIPRGKTKTKILLTDTNWIGDMNASEKLEARFRYHGALIPAELSQDRQTITLLEPHYIPEGQSLVVYHRERCLGGGTVDSAQLF